MGIEICHALIEKGAEVHLVLGPTSLPVSEDVHTVRVESAQEMLLACQNLFPYCDVGIFAAAVSDYRVKEVQTEKVKKMNEEWTLDLIKNPDILQTLSLSKQAHQKCIGFALETHNAEAYALEKLHKKQLDAIVLNTVGENSGFQSVNNSVKIFTKNNQQFASDVRSKSDIATLLLEKLDDWKILD